MKKILTILIAFACTFTIGKAQSSFSDDFESHAVNDYLGNSTTAWTTWNSAPGTAEDAWVSDKDYYSGTQSLYFESLYGYGPIDLVLPFGGVHDSGRFKFSSRWKVAAKSGGAYFNFQGDASVGSTWAFEMYMYDDGSFYAGNISGTYPIDQWFELVIDIDLTNNNWELFIDGVSQGSWANNINRVSYLNIFTLFYNTSHFVDDVSFCTNNACETDIELTKINVDPNPLCSNSPTDVEITLMNNGPDPAKSIVLGLDLAGQSRINRTLILNDLAVGKDTTITISGMFKSSVSGTGLTLKAINALGDRNLSNDAITTSIDVLPSPGGFDLVQGSTFQGRLGIGDATEPDLVLLGKTNSYNLLTGPGFSNSGYSSDWDIATVIAVTNNGYVIPSSDYTVSYPSGGSSATLSFTGSSTYLDSVITFSIAVRNVPNGCDSSVSRTLRVVPTPRPNFTFPKSICLGDDVPFNNITTLHSGTATFMWYFGDGDSSDFDNAFHIFTSPGVYQVKLVATSQPYKISDDTTISVTVSNIPTVNFRANNKCQGVPVNFQNQSTVPSGILTYSWDFGDASALSTTKDPTHLYSTPGGYKVTLNATANGCTASVTKNAYTFARPVANFSVPSTPVCSGTDILMPNSTTILSGSFGALWSFGDGTITTLKNPSHIYSNAGTYNIKLVSVSEFECKDSIIKAVVIKPAPVPAFTATRFCSNSPTVFRNTTSEALPSPVYNWTFSDNFTSTQKNLSRSWPNEGPFTVTLKASYSNGCSGTTTRAIDVLIEPKADFNVSDICSGETAQFVNLSSGDRSDIDYSWDFGNNKFSTETYPSNMYNPPTTITYTVTLVAAYENACSDTIRKNITVSEMPVCDFTYDNLGFRNVQFTPSNSNNTNYEWLFGDGGSSKTNNPKYQYTYSGNFFVTMRGINAAGCECEITKKISANTSLNTITLNSGLKVYPNPNNGSFTVSNNENKSMSIEITDVTGKVIMVLTSDNGTQLINLDSQSKGIYLVKITVDGVSSIAKVSVN